MPFVSLCTVVFLFAAFTKDKNNHLSPSADDVYWIAERKNQTCIRCKKVIFTQYTDSSSAYQYRMIDGGFAFRKNGTFEEIPASLCGTGSQYRPITGTWKINHNTIYLTCSDTSRRFNSRIYVKEIKDNWVSTVFINNN